MLLALRQKRPAVGDLRSLAIVALGVVIGFPLLTALALQHITSAHSIVFIGLLPHSGFAVPAVCNVTRIAWETSFERLAEILQASVGAPG